MQEHPMDPHSPGAPASERTKGTPFKRLTTWLGITEENHHGPPHSAQSGVPSGAPYLLGPDGKFHEVIRIDRSGRPISTPNYNELNTGYAGPPPASVRSVPAYPQQQPLFDPQIRRDYPYHGGPPHGMVTPASPSAEIPQGIQQLRAELQAAEAQFNNGRTLFATRSPDLSGAVVNVAEDDFAEFADSVAGDSSLHSPFGSISTAPAPPAADPARAGDTRSRIEHGFVPAIKLTIDNTTLDFYPMVDGFDHPAMRNPHFSGNDESSSKGKFLYYGIRKGWVRDIVDTFAAAWVRTIDFQDFTKCSAHPNGIPSECKGFNSYREAVAYLGWDPATGSPPAQKIDPKPPKRDLRLANLPGLNLGPDPHDWCGSHPMSMSVTINQRPKVTTVDDDDDSSASGSESSVSALQTLTDTINKSLKQNTDAVLRAASVSGVQRKAATKEEQSRRVLDKVGNDTFPSLELHPTVEQLHYWHQLIINQLRAPHWMIENVPITNFVDGVHSSEDFQYRSAALCRSLIGRLTTDKHMDALDEFQDFQEAGHGVSLLEAVRTYLDPHTDQLAMKEFQDFCGIKQQNGETIQATSRNIKRSYDRMQKAGFVLGAPVKLLQLVKAVITGAYAGTPSFLALAQEIIQGHLLIKDLDYERFVKRITGMMASSGLLLDNQAVKITAPRLAGRRAEGGGEASKSEFSDPWFGDINLDELSSKAQLTLTNCLCCRHPKNHAKNHHMPNCERLQKMGYTVRYDQGKDERLRINQPGTNNGNKAKKDAAARKAGIEKARKASLYDGKHKHIALPTSILWRPPMRRPSTMSRNILHTNMNSPTTKPPPTMPFVPTPALHPVDASRIMYGA